MVKESEQESDRTQLRLMSQKAKFTFFVLVAPSVLFLLLLWPLKTFGLGASADFSTFYAAGKIVRQGAADCGTK